MAFYTPMKPLLKFPDKPYEKTALYKDSIKMKEIMFHIVTKELEHRAKYHMGEDMKKMYHNISRTLIRIYIETENTEKLKFIKQLYELCVEAMVDLRAIDNSNVRLSKASYTKLLAILTEYVISAKIILGIG